MKAIEINGKIKTFRRLPNVWEDENGVHLNFDKVEDASAYGFFDVVMPSYDSRIEKLGDIHKEGNIYTYDVLDIDFPLTLSEMKEQKISNLKAIIGSELSKTDWYVIRQSDSGEEMPTDIKEKRAALRRESDEKEAEINALKTKKAVALYELPNFM